jgi:hypothetical protein
VFGKKQLSPESRALDRLLKFRLGRNRAEFLFFAFSFLQRDRLRFESNFLPQGVKECIQDDLQGLRIFHQYSFETFAVHRQWMKKIR